MSGERIHVLPNGVSLRFGYSEISIKFPGQDRWAVLAVSAADSLDFAALIARHAEDVRTRIKTMGAT